MGHITHYVKLTIALTAVVLVALASLGTALAAPQSADATKQGLFGSVAAKSATSLAVEVKEGQQVALALTADTKHRIPGVENPSLADVAVGNRVAVLASVQGDSWTALQVMVVPSRPTLSHETVTVVVERQRPAPGAIVKAKASMSAQELTERLKGHAAELKRGIANEAEARRRQEREQELEKLTQRLEEEMQQHLDRFSEVIAKAPEQAQDSLKAALENYRKGYESALEAVGKAGPEAAGPEAKERLSTLHASGTVAAVDATAGKLLVSLPNGAQLDLTTDASTKVTIEEKQATLADVSVGDSVEVAYKLKERLALRIVVRTEADARGAIQAVNTASLTLTLPDGASLTLAITPDTRVALDRKAATAAELKVGMQARVEYQLRSLQAIKIEASSDTLVDGALKSIDVQARTVTIVKADGAELTLKVTPDTRISARGLVLALKGLTASARVKVVYNASTMEARSIVVWTEVERKGPENRGRVAGLITAVDAAQGSLSIQAANGAAVTLTVTPQTKIELNGKDAKLSDLAVGMQVVVFYEADSKTAIEVKAARRPAETAHLTVRGAIAAVDVSAGTITIQLVNLPTTTGPSVTIVVTADTRVTLDGKKATLAELAKGQQALAQYRVQSKEALKLAAFSKRGERSRPTPKP